MKTNIEEKTQKIYEHLRKGANYILPFIVCGGILIVLAFLIDNYSINNLNFGKNIHFAAYLKTIGEIIFNLIPCFLAACIAKSIAGKEAKLIGFVAGLIANEGITFQSVINSNNELISSGFIGAIIAGFIAGYVVILLKKICSYLPRKMEEYKETIIYPLVGILVVSIIIVFINQIMTRINIVSATMLQALSEGNLVILGIILGAMMSIDFGGPISKAAYAFSFAMLVEGNYTIIVPVIAGAMVGPLSVALLATVKPSKFNKKERSVAISNYILGLSAISEGIIPFVVADPIRVILSCVVGSAIAGGLAVAFKCTLSVPLGGLCAISAIGNVIPFIIAVLVGTIVSTVILGLIKKDVIKTNA